MSDSSQNPLPVGSGRIARLIAPFALAMVFALAAVASLIWFAAKSQDDQAAELSRTLVDTLITGERSDLERLVYDTSWWDDAVTHLVETPDAAWADTYVGSYAADTFGVSETVVLASDNRTVFGFHDGLPVEDDAVTYYGEALARLAELARAAPMEEPEAFSAFFMAHGEVHILAASALTYVEPTPEQLERHSRSVLVQGRHLSMERLTTLSREFGIAGLGLADRLPGPDSRQRGMALAGPDGSPVRFLVWTPSRPGGELLAAVLPWLAVGVVVLIALSILFAQRAVMLAREMAYSARALAEKERQLAQASKLAVLGEMAAGVVHELNQPLNIIRMAADTTRETIRRAGVDVPSEQVTEQLELISGQTGRMSETIQGMRIFSRDDFGRKVAFDPVEATNRALSWLRPELAERDVEVKIRTPAECGRVYGEPSRFEQVIVNLVLNARDAVEQGGEDGIGRIQVAITEDRVAEKIRVAVLDNGGGIADDVLDRIFEPFFTTKAPGRGTGLGLSISYGIVSGMGGSLFAANTDEGAEFIIELPRIVPEAGAA